MASSVHVGRHHHVGGPAGMLAALLLLLCSSGLGQLVLVEFIHLGDGIEVSSNCGRCRGRARWLGYFGGS